MSPDPSLTLSVEGISAQEAFEVCAGSGLYFRSVLTAVAGRSAVARGRTVAVKRAPRLRASPSVFTATRGASDKKKKKKKTGHGKSYLMFDLKDNQIQRSAIIQHYTCSLCRQFENLAVGFI